MKNPVDAAHGELLSLTKSRSTDQNLQACPSHSQVKQTFPTLALRNLLKGGF